MASRSPTTLTVSTFPNAKALPLWCAIETSLFETFGLRLAVDETQSSKAQRDKLKSGEIQIVQAAIDNALALIKSGEDVVVVLGGESGMNDFIVQSDIADFAGMKERVLVVDSPDTAYALQARKLLAAAGLVAGVDYQVRSVGNASLRFAAMSNDRAIGGAVMNPPFSAMARLAGMRSLGSMTDLLGPYQAGGAFAMRRWAQANRSHLVNYIKAYVAALRWLKEPINRARAIDVLMRRMTLDRQVADVAFDLLIDPVRGFTPDAKIDRLGVQNMIATRAETEGAADTPLAPEDFIDPTFYVAAMSASLWTRQAPLPQQDSVARSRS